MRSSVAAIFIWGLSLPACGLLEIGSGSRITTTELVSVRVEVIELGPLNPGRVAFPSTAPITEFMPGDRVRLELEVIDTNALALADERLDSLWVQCRDLLHCLDVERSDLAGLELCDELDVWTLDAHCLIGHERGSVEFQAPPFGTQTSEHPMLAVYAIIGWDGQRAANCQAARHSSRGVPSSCGFITFVGRVGPPWWILANASSLATSSEIPTALLPPALLLQQANRAPVIDHIELEIVGESEPQVLVETDRRFGPVPVHSGDLVRLLVVPNPNEQASQAKFYPVNSQASASEWDTFVLRVEYLRLRVATTAPLDLVSFVSFGYQSVDARHPIDVQVGDYDANARGVERELARVVLVVHDGMGGETVVRVELELQ